MTELSFNKHAHQVANHTQEIQNFDDDEEAGAEKHVTIDDELPVVYKPKSFSIPDLLEDSYEASKHQHPALKFSTSNSSIESTLLRKFFPKEKTVTCSPLAQRRNRIKEAEKWNSHELSRTRGKTFPQYTDTDDVDATARSKNQSRRRSLSSNSYDTKWLNFWRKINLIPKLNFKMKTRKRTKNQQTSFHDLPPIRCSASTSDLFEGGAYSETNNNAQNKLNADDEYVFSTSKSYKPAQQCLKKNSTCDSENVQLKRIKSLPIL